MSDPRSVPTSQRPVRDGPRPTASVVVAWRGPSGLREHLLPLLETAEALGFELVVVRTDATLGGKEIWRDSEVRLITAPPESTHASMRALGLEATDGDIVVVVDDRSPRQPGWLEKIAARLVSCDRRYAPDLRNRP